MTTYATVDDVRAAYDGTIPVDAEVWVGSQLDHAEALLTATAGDLAARVTAGTTTAANVRIVECQMVIRVLRNPGGYRQQSTGPYSYMVDAGVASGRMFISREDRRLLGLRRGASSMSLADGDDGLRHPHRLPPYPRWHDYWGHPSWDVWPDGPLEGVQRP